MEYKTSGVEYVTLVSSKDDSKDDVAKLLITNGLVQAEGRREKHLAKLIAEYKSAEEAAKDGRVRCYFVCLIFLSYLFVYDSQNYYIVFFSKLKVI